MTRRVMTRAASLALGILAASTVVAVAQEGREATTGLVDVRGQGVMDRARPGYDAAGIRAGGFVVYPKASVTGSFNDNVYATQNNKEEDFITTLAARVDAVSTWSSHALHLRGGVSQDLYADNSDEDSFNWDIGAGGQIDITRNTALTGNVGYAELHEDRGEPSTPTNAADPIEYSLFTAGAGLKHSFNRVTVGLSADMRDYDYDDATSNLGAVIPQDQRDRKEYYERLRLGYNVSPDTNVYIEGQLDQREYDQQPPAVPFTRDSDGWQVVVGSEFRMTNLAKGGVYIGYQERDYDAAGFGKVDGLAYGANVEWFATPLTTVTFEANASVEETTDLTSSGYDRNQFGIGVDHELQRNLILRGGLSYANNDYNETAREDDILGARLGLVYLVNRNFDVELGYNYTDRDSNVAGFDYKRNVVGLTLTGKL